MDLRVADNWKLWNEQTLEDTELAEELERICGREEEIRERFYKDLEFGTGGLRGIIGAGTNRMNIYTVAKATQGYADYLLKHYAAPSVSIAYDSRIKSDQFAKISAEVFAANGIRVHLYRELMPTPALSFAIRHLTCSGGVVITASHNPANYNGYKVYGEDGCQITTTAAREIWQQIEKVSMFDGVKRLDFEEGAAGGIICYINDSVVTAYLDAVSSQSLCKDEEIDKDVSIVYTPLNGAGLTCVTRCLRENGFTNVSVVKEQEEPDGNFPTCPYPNPEMKEALELGLRDAKKLGSDLLLATDPDCDRVGIAVRSADGYTLLSGNEVGLLLLDYICKRRIASGSMPKNPILMKTIVTIDMAKQIAGYYGVKVIDVLTGFKFIGEQIGLLEAKGEEDRFILGFEESYGYLTGSYVRDKDGVNASLMICEMFAFYKARGKSLLDILDDLYKQFGYCLNTQHCYEFEGVDGFHAMQKIMENFRHHCPEAWCGHKIVSVSDYKSSITRYGDGRTEMIELPASNVLKYTLEGNSTIVVRPSGTEPKLKMYYSVSASNKTEAEKLEKQFTKEAEMFFK